MKLFELANQYCKESTWKTMAMLKFCLIAMGIAIGMFISSLTESQVIAAIGTLAVSLLLLSVDVLSSIFYSISWISKVTDFLSISTRYSDFTTGLINYDNVIFFLTLQALFIFLTVRVLDSKRWN